MLDYTGAEDRNHNVRLIQYAVNGFKIMDVPEGFDVRTVSTLNRSHVCNQMVEAKVTGAFTYEEAGFTFEDLKDGVLTVDELKTKLYTHWEHSDLCRECGGWCCKGNSGWKAEKGICDLLPWELSQFPKESYAEFKDTDCKDHSVNGVKFILQRKEDNTCFFLQDSRCSVHDRKPLACYHFSCMTNWENLPKDFPLSYDYRNKMRHRVKEIRPDIKVGKVEDKDWSRFEEWLYKTGDKEAVEEIRERKNCIRSMSMECETVLKKGYVRWFYSFLNWINNLRNRRRLLHAFSNVEKALVKKNNKEKKRSENGRP